MTSHLKNLCKSVDFAVPLFFFLNYHPCLIPRLPSRYAFHPQIINYSLNGYRQNVLVTGGAGYIGSFADLNVELFFYPRDPRNTCYLCSTEDAPLQSHLSGQLSQLASSLPCKSL